MSQIQLPRALFPNRDAFENLGIQIAPDTNREGVIFGSLHATLPEGWRQGKETSNSEADVFITPIIDSAGRVRAQIVTGIDPASGPAQSAQVVELKA